MLNTVLFDLDGTLLPMDMNKFMNDYFEALCNKCKHIIGCKELIASVWASTEYMTQNMDKDKTNIVAFMEDFQKRINIKLEDILPTLNEFYAYDFKSLKRCAKPSDTVVLVVQVLKEKGYQMVVATNPLFPRQAILHRIEWAGLKADDFIFITDYETMHYCKPHVEYYKEILSIIGKTPQECLMVGNDVQEDLVAGKLGIRTFLINNNMIHREKYEPKADYIGDYNDLLKFIKALPNLKQE